METLRSCALIDESVDYDPFNFILDSQVLRALCAELPHFLSHFRGEEGCSRLWICHASYLIAFSFVPYLGAGLTQC